MSLLGFRPRNFTHNWNTKGLCAIMKSIHHLLLLACVLFFSSTFVTSQSVHPSRIVGSVDENQLVVLTGNTHPLVHGAQDSGSVSPILQMDRMFLVLRRSPAQQAA